LSLARLVHCGFSFSAEYLTAHQVQALLWRKVLLQTLPHQNSVRA
jgi:hypothetical protein